MKKIRITQMLAIMAFVGVFSPAFAQSGDEWLPIIAKINQEMGQALIEGNIEKSMSFYAVDAISMPNNGNILEGADVIRKSMLGMLNSGSKVISYNAKTLYVMLCSDKIIEIGKFRISFTVPGKPEVEEDTGKYMTVWEKAADGTLKIKVETWNSDAPPVAEE